MITPKSEYILSGTAPTILNIVASIDKSIIGSISGKASTGNNAPFDDAFDISADIIVEAADIPIPPQITHSIYIP